MAAKITVEMKGLDSLIARADGTRLLRRPLRRGLRRMGKVMKAHVVAIARPISASLARRVKVEVDRDFTPKWVKVVNRAAWVHVAERGRRPGAKGPPMGKLRGGFAAGRVVSARGLPGHRVMARAAAASQRDVAAVNREISREMEAAWNARGRR